MPLELFLTFTSGWGGSFLHEHVAGDGPSLVGHSPNSSDTNMRSFRPSLMSSRDSRASTFVKPSMHSEFLSRKDSNGTRHGRVRSLSNESDSGKQRLSVPLLYASTISSMSTLSSSFYQYDSTGGGAVLELDHLPTPVSMDSSTGGSRKKRTPKTPHQDASLRLPAVQERALRTDAARMSRELIAEQLEALDMLHNRNAFVRTHSTSTIGEEVATAKGVRVFEKPGIGGGGLSGRVKKHAVKRYTAHWQVRATVDEIVALLTRNDRDLDRYMSVQNMLHPETVNSKLLWRAADSSSVRSTSQRTLSTHDNDDGVITIELDRDELQLHSDRARGGHGKPFPSGPRKMPAPQVRRRRRRRAPEWMGINWWVQHMPQKLSRDRDFIVLEKQSEFETQGIRSPVRRGFVHLCHSVDLADVSNEKRLVSPFVRGLMIQSGLVVVESDEPGVLDVANTLEIDCSGHLSAGQQRQLIIKRLLQVDAWSELLWKSRLIDSQLLLWKPRVEKTSDTNKAKCHRCQFKSSLFSRRPMSPCRVCDRVVCTNCSSTWEFTPELIAAASPDRQLPKDVNQNGVLKACICSHCVIEYSRPRLERKQSSAEDTYYDDDDDDDDEEYELEDMISDHPLESQPNPLRTKPRPSSAPIMWDPSRSSRIAETLVDDFLLNMSPSAGVLPTDILLSPSALSDEMDHYEPVRPHDERPEEEEPLVDIKPDADMNVDQERPRAPSVRRSSMAHYTPLPGVHEQPRRKTSIFESIPEPAPRKNVVLYEG